MYHIPVLSDECMRLLEPDRGGVFLDGTLGGGGHSELILSQGKAVRLIAFDKDAEAIAYAGQRLSPYSDRLTLIHDDFKNAPAIVEAEGVSLNGVLLDLGISSRQIDEADRGFSYMADAPLDMRMDREQGFSAFEVVNAYSEDELRKIFFEYGEERNSKRIAAAIVKNRQTKKIATTKQLADIVANSAHFDPRGGHPAKRVFQSIRIEVNDELKGLGEAIKQLSLKLTKGGRIAVISFHSLEDRIVKQALKQLELKCVCPPRMPICTCGKRQEVKILTTKPITASEAELKANPRAASAKLRAAERI